MHYIFMLALCWAQVCPHPLELPLIHTCGIFIVIIIVVATPFLMKCLLLCLYVTT